MLKSSGWKLFKELKWAFGGKILAALGVLIGVRGLTEVVSKDVYGKVSLLVGIMALATDIFAAPLLQAAYRFYPEVLLSGNIHSFYRTIFNVLKRLIAIVVVLILAGGAVYTRFSTLSFLAFLVLAGLVVVSIIRAFKFSFLVSAHRQKSCAIWEVSESFSKPFLAILMVLLLGRKSQFVLLGYFVAILGVILCFRYLSRNLEGIDTSKELFTPDKKLLKDIRRYAIPMIPLALVTWIISLSDRYIIGGFLGTEKVGIYAASYGLISIPFLLTGSAMTQVLRPHYFDVVSSGQKNLSRKLFILWFFVVFFISALGGTVVFFFRHWIARFFLAEEYRSGALLMPWIAAGIGFQIMGHVYNFRLMAEKWTHFILLSYSIGAAISIITVYYMVRQFGLVGAAIACPVYYLSVLLCMMVLAEIGEKFLKPQTREAVKA